MPGGTSIPLTRPPVEERKEHAEKKVGRKSKFFCQREKETYLPPNFEVSKNLINLKWNCWGGKGVHKMESSGE